MTIINNEQFANKFISIINDELQSKGYTSDFDFDFSFTKIDLPFDFDKELFLDFFRQNFNIYKINLDNRDHFFRCYGRIKIRN